MTDKKRSRMSLLDSLASAGAAMPPPSMMASNRALRSARDAVDNHHVWELDPAQIIDDRLRDRLDLNDIVDLRDAIEANGQTVPILVRRHPTEADRYLLVYGARRLEAIRSSDKVKKIRALVANLDDQGAVTAQISENMARRDLSFIEKALFARELVDSGYGNQNQVAEVLTVTKSSVSMALAVVDMVGVDLIDAIGPAHGVGRPRWEALGKTLAETGQAVEPLVEIAHRTRAMAQAAPALTGQVGPDPSLAAFEAVENALRPAAAPVAKVKLTPKPPKGLPIMAQGRTLGQVTRTGRGLKLDLDDKRFADWLEAEAPDVIADLHARYLSRREDQ